MPVPPVTLAVRRITAQCGLALALALVAACNGTTDQAGKMPADPAATLARAMSSLDSAGCYHVRSHLGPSTFATAVDYDGEVLGDRTKGTMALDGLKVPVVRLGSVAYLFSTPEYVAQSGGPEAFKNRWVKNPLTATLAVPGVFTTPDLVKLGSPNGPVTGAAGPSVEGRETTSLTFEVSSGTTATVLAQEGGKGYPLRVELNTSGKSSGAITLDGFEATCTISPPAKALNP